MVELISKPDAILCTDTSLGSTLSFFAKNAARSRAVALRESPQRGIRTENTCFERSSRYFNKVC